ncbi:MAG: ROK family protein, partial [Verrucomicrobia bacterium]|nr:ROK family protein [Verrucomicrobiota bacterium]
MKLVAPEVTPVLEPAFRPAVLANAAFRKAVKVSRQGVAVIIALEQADGSVFHFNTEIFPEGHAEAKQNAAYLERFVKFLLWSRGGFRVHFAGPRVFGEELQRYYK